MADQTNRILGTVDVQDNSEGRVAYEMTRFYEDSAGIKSIEDTARLFALFMKIMRNPFNSDAYIREYKALAPKIE